MSYGCSVLSSEIPVSSICLQISDALCLKIFSSAHTKIVVYHV